MIPKKKKATKSHNWNQMKEDTREEHMSCQRLTCHHYPIREQQCQRPTSSYYPVRERHVPEILRGQGDINKGQSLDSNRSQSRAFLKCNSRAQQLQARYADCKHSREETGEGGSALPTLLSVCRQRHYIIWSLLNDGPLCYLNRNLKRSPLKRRNPTPFWFRVIGVFLWTYICTPTALAV